jgi:hypothetical protein
MGHVVAIAGHRTIYLQPSRRIDDVRFSIALFPTTCSGSVLGWPRPDAVTPQLTLTLKSRGPRGA